MRLLKGKINCRTAHFKLAVEKLSLQTPYAGDTDTDVSPSDSQCTLIGSGCFACFFSTSLTSTYSFLSRTEIKMIGSFLTRGLVMVFGYAYPAYECYKTVEMNKPDIVQLRFWCQYWILVAMLTVCERVGDTFISWVPMYSEAKLAFFIYLWCPKTKGTTYVYESFFRPLVAEHENEIDRSLSELRTQASDLVVLYGQKAISYGQTRVFDVLHYIASQSNPAHPAVKKKQDQGVTNRKETSKPVTTAEKPVSLPRTSSNQKKKDDDVSEENASQKHAATLSTAALNTRNVAPAPTPTESSKSSSSNEAKAMEINDSVVTKENAEPNLQETVIEETGRVTRARSRKTHTPTK